MRPALLALVPLVLLVACSDSNGSAITTDSAPAVTICDPASVDPQTDDQLPNVAAIAEAIDALTAELAAPPEFFEVNATASVVNLFVALNDGTKVQPWVYVNGELSSDAVQDASGGTFTAADLDFDPDTVLQPLRDQLPDTILESFYVNGDGQGNVQYGVLASAVCGGGLDVIVSRDGEVLSVDPV